MLAVSAVQGQLKLADKLMIREAENIRNAFGGKIWQDLDKVPFTVLFLSDTGEFLIHHPAPGDDFQDLGYDSVLGTTIWYRKAVFPKTLLATFPAIGGINCIVAGSAENTGKSPTSWITTLLHEHFHLYEYTSPGYYDGVDSLQLSEGDQSGMWMLNYPYPYQDRHVQTAMQEYRHALSECLQAAGVTSSSCAALPMHRKKLAELAGEKNQRYLDFQLWQEGTARYTEYKYLQALSQSGYSASPAVQALPDFIPFEEYREQLYKDEMSSLRDCSLPQNGRICFYAVGFAEGLLLDVVNPGWHSLFLEKKFRLPIR